MPRNRRAVHVGRAAIDALRRGGLVIFVRAPVQVAVRRIERENIVFRRTDERAVDLDQTGRKAGILAGVVGAENLQPADILRVDLIKLRVTIRGQRLVVARPIFRW